MKISIADGSNYFRGLLILIRKDHEITQPEVDHMVRIGKLLGFEKEFVDNCINDILDNEYVADTPPVFSAPDIAKKFIKDGLAVALSDNDFHPDEEKWLVQIVEKNNLSHQWYLTQKQDVIFNSHHSHRLEVEDMEME